MFYRLQMMLRQRSLVSDTELHTPAVQVQR
jgi:hypothetical protein